MLVKNTIATARAIASNLSPIFVVKKFFIAFLNFFIYASSPVKSDQ